MQLTKCVCGCGAASIAHVGWYYVPQKDRGGRDAYMCPDCAKRQGTSRGIDTKGALCGGGIAYRVAFPTATTSAAAHAYALKNDWARIGAGYVSPVWRNLNSPKKQFVTWELMRNAGKFALANNSAPLTVGVWDGFDAETAARIERNRAVLFGNAPAMVSEDGITLDTYFTTATDFMATMKTAKAMMQYLLAWLEKPTASRAAKVRRYFNVAAHPDGVALPAVGLPA